MKSTWWIVAGVIAGFLAGYYFCHGCNNHEQPKPIVITEKALHDTIKILVDSSKARVGELNKKIAAKDKEIAVVNSDLRASRLNEQILAEELNKTDNPSLAEVNDYIAQVKEANKDCDKQLINFEGKIRLLGAVISEKDTLQANTLKVLDTAILRGNTWENYSKGIGLNLKKQKQSTKLWKYLTPVAGLVGLYIGSRIK
jgi:hypothetical protein